MNSILGIIKNIIEDVLYALYQPFWYAVVLAIFYMLIIRTYQNIGNALKAWYQMVKNEKKARWEFLLAFFIVMILFRTLFNRNLWQNPLSDIMGGWGIYKIKNGEKELTTECLENLVLFIPFSTLLFVNYKEKLMERINLRNILWNSAKITFLFSFTIEMLQLFLRLGTWQLSDLFYNTIGGMIGGILFWIAWKWKTR